MAKKPVQNHQKLDLETIQDIQNSFIKALAPHINAPFYLLTVEFEREMGEWYLRIYITKGEGRVSLGDCETITREIDTLIDEVTDTMPLFKDFPFHAEVSSPGLFKVLKSQREFDYYQNSPVQANLYKPLDKKRETPETQIIGTLKSADTNVGSITLLVNTEERTLELNAQTEISLHTELNLSETTLEEITEL